MSSAKLLKLIKNSLRCSNEVKSYSMIALQDSLKKKLPKRFPIARGLQKINVIAFGTNDWEQYGFWESFYQFADFYFYDYQKGVKKRHPYKVLNSEIIRVTNEFLLLVDQAINNNSSQNSIVAFFYAYGGYISNKLIRELHNRKVWTIILSLDDKQQFIQNKEQFRVATRCDLYVTNWKLGAQIILKNNGSSAYFPEAADPEYFYPMHKKRDIQILFIGKAYGFRSRFIRKLRRIGFQVETFGQGWPNGKVPHKEMLELIGRSVIVLGIGGVGHMRGVKHLKGRDFEVPMSGALYLTTYNPELADHFIIGKEILCYSSFEDCVDLVYWIIGNPETADRIRNAALIKSRAQHTWMKRTSDIFSILSNI